MASPPLRKDSARTRESILDAAEKLLATDARASFTEISVAAGVSPATVYRHFADRPGLLVALLERSLEEIEDEVRDAPVGPGSFEAVLRIFSVHQARYQGVLSAVRRGEVEVNLLVDLEARTLEVFRKHFDAARQAGTLDDRLQLEDVIVLLAMIDGALSSVTDQPGREQVASQALQVVLHGVRVGR